MQRYGQKTSKIPPKWGFSPICDPPRFFFKNRALSLLYPYGALTSCKKLEKTNERSLRYLKTDQRTDGPRTRVITLRAETFAGRNFRDFRDFWPFSRKFLPGKKLSEKFAKVIFAKKRLFRKIAKKKSFFRVLKVEKERFWRIRESFFGSFCSRIQNRES